MNNSDSPNCTCQPHDPHLCDACRLTVSEHFRRIGIARDKPGRRILSFTGTRREFLLWLEAMVDLQDVAGVPPEFVPLDAGQTYEWELTASIARHPAGKGLRSGDFTWDV